MIRSLGFYQMVVSVATLAVLSSGCGVKGKPLPPLEPAAIGRGAPTYKGAAMDARPTILPTGSPTVAPSQGNGTSPVASPTPALKSEGR